MKRRYSVELTSEQLAFLVCMLGHRIQLSADEKQVAQSIIYATFDARPIPEPLRLAKPKARGRRQPAAQPEREKAQ